VTGSNNNVIGSGCYCHFHMSTQGTLVLIFGICEVIYQSPKTVFDHISDTEKRIENTTPGGVFLTNFEVFGNVVTLSGVFDISC